MQPGDIFEGGVSISRRGLLQGAAAVGAGAVIATQLTRGGVAGARLVLTGAGAPVLVAAPAVVHRAQWGANEALRRAAPTFDPAVDKIVLHHTGTPNGVADWAGQVRAIYQNEVTTGYADIAYHYLVDPNGVVYEGRWARDFAPNEVPDATNAWGGVVHGAHAGGHNGRTLGVALLGDYMSASITPACMTALVALLAWQCARWGLDPRGAGPYVDDAGGSEWLANVCPHGSTSSTLCPGSHVDGALDAIRGAVADHMRGVPTHPAPPAPPPPPQPGYWIVGPDGRTVAFGGVPALAHARPLRAPIAGVAADPQHRGFWAFAFDGGVFSYGRAPFHGSAARVRLRAPIVTMDVTPTGEGYWLAGSDGGVFTFGDAHFYGSVAGHQLRAPVVAMARTTTGRGYYLLASDGGVFAFGDANFYGSLANEALQGDAVDIVATKHGYWIAGADGGVFTFGDARFQGNARGRTRARVVAMSGDPSGRGYLLLTADGHVLAFGRMKYHGSATKVLPAAVGVAVVPT